MTDRVTLLDAFLIPLIVGDIGIPMLGTEMLGRLDVPPSLAPRVEAQLNAYRKIGPGLEPQILEVETLLARYGLAVPRRPQSGAEYPPWSDMIFTGVMAATGPAVPAGLTFGLGRLIGELGLCLALHITFSELRTRAPAAATVSAQDELLRERLGRAAEVIAMMATLPMLPAALRPAVERLAAMANRLIAFDAETPVELRADGLKKLHQGLGQSVGPLCELLGGM